MSDIAGNSLATATTLNLTTGVQSFPDLVTSTASDFYRFSLTSRSSIGVSLTNLDANADVTLLDNNGDLLSVDGVLQRSENSGNLSESITTTLAPGTYFIRVNAAPATAIANYTLNVTQGANSIDSSILWRNPVTDQTGIWLVNGPNLISTEVFSLNPGVGWVADATGDFNRDSQSDIFWRNANTGATQIWPMNGLNPVSAVALSSAPAGWYVGGTGDFTKDGQTDLLWRNDAEGLTGIWALNGTQFVSAVLFPGTVPSVWRIAGVGDFNNDGNPDIVWQNSQDQIAGFWLMNGTSVLSTVQIPGVIPANWSISGADDFNQDGSTDLLWRNYTTLENGVWLFNGVVFSSAYALPAAPPDWIPTVPFDFRGAPIPIDLAGTTLATAFDLGTNLTGTGSFQDSISNVNTEFYKFTLGTASQVNLSLSNFTSNLDLQLLDGNGGIVQTSVNADLSPELIARTLAAGTYYIQVIPNSAGNSTLYSLGLGVNNIPVVSTNTPLVVNEQGTANLTSSQLRVTDDNPDSQLTYTLGALPANGTLSVNGSVARPGTTFTQTDLNSPDRIQYIHNGSETTSDSFIFTVADGVGGTTGTTTFNISVTPVNDPPVVSNPGPLTLEENLNNLISGIQVADPDSGTGPLTITLSVRNGTLTLGRTNNITGLQGNGTSTVSFSGQLGLINFALQSLVYRSNSNYQGPDTLTIVANDNGNTGIGGPLSDTKTTNLTVTLVNQPPSITIPASPSVNSDTDLSIAGISIADPDAAGSNLSVSISAANGFVSLPNTTGLTFVTAGNGSPNNLLVFRGSLLAINAALATLTYRSYPGFTNSFDLITVSVTDNGNTGLGIALGDTETLLVNVGNAVNVPPVATNDSYGVTQNNTLNGNSVLRNDTDPDFTLPLTAQLGARPTQAASFSLNPDGTFTYTPVTNFNGNDSFTYTTRDALGGVSNTATVNITVTPVNQPPVATNDTYTTGSRGSLVVSSPGILANDTDIESSSLSAVLVSSPVNGTLSFNANGSFTYVPRAGFTGTDSFTYRANDGSLNSANPATVNISVTLSPNQPPVATGDTFITSVNSTLSLGSVLANDTDLDNNIPLTASLVAGPANAASFTLNSNGTFTYIPRTNFTGNDTFTYVARDSLGGTSTPATVTFNVTSVNPGNQPPVATGDTFITSVNSTLSLGSVLANDTDLDNNIPLTASLVAGPANAASFTLNSNGTFTYIPRANFTGNDTFTYVARDSLGGTSTPATVTFSVTPGTTGTVIVANNDSLSVNAGSSLNIAAPGILSNDTDPQGRQLSATVISTVTSGTLSLSQNGAFIYTPNANFSGSDRFTYVATDGTGTSNTATVSIRVNAIPVATNDTYTATVGIPLTVTGGGGFGILGNDTDLDRQTLSATVVSNPANGTLSLGSNGSFVYTPTAGFTGADSFTYTATDGLATSNPATVSISVRASSTPVATSDTYRAVTNGTLTVTSLGGVLSNDPGGTGTARTATTVAGPSSGVLTLNPDGSFVYRPNPGFQGVDRFVYRFNEGSAVSNPATVTLSVSSNSPPVANGDRFVVARGGVLSVSTTQSILFNDRDPDGTTLAVASNTTPANGSLNLNPNGTFTYTPNAGFFGVDSFTYRATDGISPSNLATVTLTVATPPTAVADTFSVVSGQSLVIGAPAGLLANDTDSNGLSLRVVPGGTTRNGSLTVANDGSFTYTPRAGFTGTDSFTYRANNGVLNSSVVTVTLNVT